MYTVLRLSINKTCPRFVPCESDSKLNDLLLEGSYLPWQIQHTVPQRRYPGALKILRFNRVKRLNLDPGRAFHEAGHGLVKVYENREADLYDIDGQLKFLTQFDVPKSGWGKKAGMTEARVHAFSILIQDAIDPEDTLGDSLRIMQSFMPGHCQDIADGEFDKEAEAPYAEEMERIFTEFTPDDILTMWKELCAKLHAHHQTIDMEEMAATIDAKVCDSELGWIP